MAVLGLGGQPRSAGAFIQARPSLVTLLLLACLAGCSNHQVTGPETWWHDWAGGKVAQSRPPPPGDKDPYPNLATVPAKPAKPDTAAWNRMTAGLITDRINAREAAALAPIPPMSIPPLSIPALSAGATASKPPGAASPRADDQEASAAMVGASPPPVAQGKAASGAKPATQPPSGVVPPAPAIPSVAAEAAFVANGHLPPLPTREPARPDIAPAPPPPLVPVTAEPPPAPRLASDSNQIDFPKGAATLDDPALAAVKALAATLGNRGVAVTGYGDAATSDAVGQSAALGLGLSRAQAVATALVADGVPYARLRLNAEAAGRGATLRLLQ